ncbi:SPASM domain-containing protein [candidate division KSB1 bacterium]|nr:SPASM domain-containing protein [candidate division KSB1 bacterium]
MRELWDWGILKPIKLHRIINLFRIHASFYLSLLLKKSRVWGVPYILTIEPTNRCNLRCPQCATGAGMLKRRVCDLNYEHYKKIIDEMGRSLWYLILYNQGEPFLHRDLLAMIRYAKKYRIYVITSTNGHFLGDDHLCEDLVHSDLDKIIISLEGADEASYESYRRGGDFHRVIDGIKHLTDARKRLKRKNPRIIIQSLVTRGNEHELGEINKLVSSLGADKLIFKTIQIIDSNGAEKYIPLTKKFRRYETEGADLQLKNLLKPCKRLWTSTTILSNGEVVPCCFDKHGRFTFGMIERQQTVTSIWRSIPYEQFRTKSIKNRRGIDICNNCSQGQKIYIQKALNISLQTDPDRDGHGHVSEKFKSR